MKFLFRKLSSTHSVPTNNMVILLHHAVIDILNGQAKLTPQQVVNYADNWSIKPCRHNLLLDICLGSK